MSKTKPIQIAVLGVTFGAGNLGVSVLASGVLKCIAKQFPDARVFVLEYAKTPECHAVQLNGRDVSVPVVNMRFSKKIYLPNNIAVLLLIATALKLVPFRSLRDWIVARNTCLREIAASAFVAAMSGGDSFSDIYGLERLLYVSLPQILALLMGKKLILLPQTIGPFRGWFAKGLARFILRRAERIYSRDYQGTKEVRNLLGPSHAPDRVGFCYDVGFVLDPVPPATLEVTGLPLAGDRRSPLVGLNVSGLLYRGGYPRGNMFGLLVDYKKFIFGLIDFLITKRNASVLLVPHVFGASAESDQPVCAEVYNHLRDTYPGRLELLQGTYNQNEIKYVIGRCDFFIGSRMHACIAAISQCLPSVCVAYSDKFVGVMETLGIDFIVADARRMSEMEIYRTIGSVFDDRDAIRRQLEREIPRVKALVLDLFQSGPHPEAVPVSSTVSERHVLS